LYDRVEGIRLRRGWTRVQVAQHIGVDRKTIDNWKTNMAVPLAPTVIRVAEKLGLDREEVLRLAGLLPGGVEGGERGDDVAG
jgi:transcriptional regulator with XRE-family HTH domain